MVGVQGLGVRSSGFSGLGFRARGLGVQGLGVCTTISALNGQQIEARIRARKEKIPRVAIANTKPCKTLPALRDF